VSALLSIVTLWWLSFFTIVGLCLGSFLNVVIHRLPLGIDLAHPRWSFCPRCGSRIAWYDNLPVVSFLLLRGRCRHCHAPISAHYPLIELLTAVVVVSLFDAFFLAQSRAGLQTFPDLAWRLSADWPVFLAHVILFVCLLGMSSIDLQFYWVDIRFTHFAALCGVLLHTIWTPYHSRDWFRPYDATAAATVVAFIAFAIVWLLLPERPEEDHTQNDQPPETENTPPETLGDDSSGPSENQNTMTDGSPPVEADSMPHQARSTAAVEASWPPAARRGGTAMLVAGLLLFAAVWSAVCVSAVKGGWLVPHAYRAGLPLLCGFLAIVFAAARKRESDGEIAEAIEFEAPAARRGVLRELLTLAPAILLGALTLIAFLNSPKFADTVREVIHWRPFNGAWRPLLGLSTAVSGYVIAAGIGWTVRILANFIWGKEAFATGDIHMMAAAGAVAGWQVVLIGFVIACLSAIAGWLLLLPLKRSRVIPLGPWLTIGFWTTTLFYNPIVESNLVQRFADAVNLLFLNNSQPSFIGGTP
jgi:prepilin signal peptidase PulO-like enzyme (type II secretory pathway)